MHTVAETQCLFLIKANLSQLIKLNLNHITVVIYFNKDIPICSGYISSPVHVTYKDTHYINTTYESNLFEKQNRIV